MTYHEAVSFLTDLSRIQPLRRAPKQHTKAAFNRMKRFLNRAGNPERAIPNFIHVTGTSGKGSVTMGLAKSLCEAGYSVGAYTSPHLTTPIERFWTDGRLMSPNRFVELVEWLKPLLEATLKESTDGLPSFVELMVVMALEHFRREGVEWVVLEANCGGMYDATNVIPPPRAAVITSVGKDHVPLLGTTIKEIALAKAGIIKSGCPVFTHDPSPSTKRLLRKITHDHRGTFHEVQGGNLELITTILNNLFDTPPTPQVFSLPGRFEVLSTSPFTVLDIAHNADKCAYLVRTWKAKKLGKAHLLVAVSFSKDAKAILEELLPIAASVTFVPFRRGHRSCLSPQDLAKIAKRLSPRLSISVALSPEDALRTLQKQKEPILITGSTFLGNDLRTAWIPESVILKTRTAFPKR